MAKVKLPAGPKELSAAWLTSAMRETGTISDAAVTGFECETIGEGVGVLGQLARVRLTYDAPDGGPATLVAKFPATMQENRDLANLFRFYEREVRFYEEIAEEVALRTPRRYYSRFDPETCEYTLLLEDMHPSRCGNQVEGCPPVEAKTLLCEMARFHATWWNHPRLSTSFAWVPMGNDPVQHSAEPAFNDSLGPCLKNLGDRLSPRMLEITERFRDKIIAIEDVLSKPPITIAHGDLRYDNLFFSDDGEMAVADWQIVLRARGAYDAGYFMSQSVEPEERRKSEMEILRAYHETLLENGVKDYSFEQCFDDYRTSAMFCLVYPVIAGGTLDLANERGTALVTAMLDRSVATILDLNCDEMIPA